MSETAPKNSLTLKIDILVRVFLYYYPVKFKILLHKHHNL